MLSAEQTINFPLRLKLATVIPHTLLLMEDVEEGMTNYWLAYFQCEVLMKSCIHNTYRLVMHALTLHQQQTNIGGSRGQGGGAFQVSGPLFM